MPRKRGLYAVARVVIDIEQPALWELKTLTELKVSFETADSEEEAVDKTLRCLEVEFPKYHPGSFLVRAKRIGDLEVVHPVLDPREDPELDELRYPEGDPLGLPVVVWRQKLEENKE